MLPSFQSQDPVSKIGLRLSGLKERVSSLLKQMGRDDSVMIVASSRALMADPVMHAAQAGIRHFCEEFLPEGISKKPVVDHRVPGLTWHFCGRIPNQKMKLAVDNFDWIHSIDKITQLSALREALGHREKKVSILIEVNPLGVEKRNGANPSDLEAIITQIQGIPNANFKGLSFKTEHFLTLDKAAEGFKRMQDIFENLKSNGVLPKEGMHLAMGSSRDYESAILQGSTMIRQGSSIFGEDAYQMMGGNELETFDL
ncbi:MAG: YggS family pyridoxal phosphate-dependent enzyme [Bdellovibrionales bacterium]|nr:YggS family pyridoxal phosphate-dependent enzyme [Bdellovibrionales bacterium]